MGAATFDFNDGKGGKGIMAYRLQRLLTVKSIVTIMLTIGFLVMSLTSTVPDTFANIYQMIVVFYFGTQVGVKDNKDPTN